MAPITLHAHFDGRMIVPDQAIDLPPNTPLRIQVTVLEPQDSHTETSEAIKSRLVRLAAATALVSASSPTDEALRRESLYDERP